MGEDYSFSERSFVLLGLEKGSAGRVAHTQRRLAVAAVAKIHRAVPREGRRNTLHTYMYECLFT